MRKISSDSVQKISQKQVAQIEKRLEERAHTLQAMKSHASRSAAAEVEVLHSDEVDLASSQEAAESNRMVAEAMRLELIQVADALGRIRAGSFGVCEECDCTIPTRRLEIRPEARLCIDCQSEEERHFGRPFVARGDVAFAS